MYIYIYVENALCHLKRTYSTTFRVLCQANSIMLGWEVQYMSSNMEISTALTTCSIVFAIWFILEVLVRLRVVGVIPFFCNDDHLWNICDLGLVAVSIVELILLFAGNAKTPFSTIKATLKLINHLILVMLLFPFWNHVTNIGSKNIFKYDYKQ